MRAGPPRTLMLALALCAAFAIAPAAASAASTDQAVAYQLDPAHDGYQTADPITAPLSEAWSITLPGAISYPLIVNGVVYVTAAESSGYGTTLYAIEQATGATLWSHALGGTYSFSGLAYDAGQIFTVDYNGQLSAFDAATGASDWSVTLPGQSSFTSPPTAANGYVYVGGAGTGGTLYAVSESSGALAWTASVENGDHSSPAVSSSGVYVTYACDQDYDFNPLTGSLIWHHSGSCEGGGGKTPVLADGELFGRDAGSGNVVLSAAGGADSGTFGSTYAPAAGGGDLFTAGPGSLAAIGDWGSGSTAWSFSGDSDLDTAPLLDGSLVFEGSSTGELYALDAATGATVWSTDTGAAIAAPDEQNADSLTGLGAGENTLIVPAGDTLLAYTGADLGSGTPADSVAPTVSGTPVATEAVGADVGVWSALPTGYTYRWSLCDAGGANCANITTNGTAESYTPPSTDVGDTLEVTVSATNPDGTATAVTSAASSPIEPPPPSNEELPSITGSAAVGQTLTAATGSWSNDPTTYAYQWLRCQSSCTPIAGATSSTYLVGASDEQSTLEVEVAATNGAGGASADSPATATVQTPTAVTLTSSQNPAGAGVTITLTATVSPEVDGGTLVITQDGQSIPGCPAITMTSQLLGVSCTGPIPQSGSYTITATYSGDGGFAGSSATLTQTITGTSSPAPAAADPVDVVIDANPPATAASPTITFSESGPVASTVCTIDGVGTPCSTSQAALTNLAAGHHTFQVTVSGGGASATAQVSWVLTPPVSLAKTSAAPSKKKTTKPVKHKKTKKHRKHRKTKKKTKSHRG